MIFGYLGKDYFFVGLANTKMELEKIVVKGIKYLSLNKFYGYIKYLSNVKYICVFIF